MNRRLPTMREDRRLRDVRKVIDLPPDNPMLVIEVIGGNTLDSGITGVKYLSSLETELPSDYDPDTDPSTADGWGTGYLFVNGLEQEHKVIILNDQHSGFGHGLVEGWKLYVATPLRMKVSGTDTYRTVYSGWCL